MNRENKRKTFEKGYYKNHPCNDSFTCKVCGRLVTPDAAGTDHRNHCPNCLSSLHVDIEPEEKKQILACRLPKLCLQPLVENAILHAFNEITTGGRVTLKAFCTDGNLSIVVADNGSGMSPEQLKKLDASIHAEHVEEGKEHGIGLHNVNRRIQLLFGKEYGLSVKSFSGIGTFVEVFLPMRTEPFDEE